MRRSPAHSVSKHWLVLAPMAALGLFVVGCGQVDPASAARLAGPAALKPLMADARPAPRMKVLRELASYYEPGWEIGPSFAVASGRAYLVDAQAGLHVVDVSDPLKPHALGTVLTDHRFREVVAAGTMLYGREWVDSQGVDVSNLIIVDAADLQQPKVLGNLRIRDVREMVVEDGKLYYDTFGERGGAQVFVLDVRDPATLVQVGAYKSDAPDERIVDLQVDRGVAFFLTYNPSLTPTRLDSVDFSNPAAPRRLGSLRAPKSNVMRLGTGVAVLRGQDVELVDLRDPSAMRRLARTEDPDGFSSAQQFAASGTYALLAIAGNTIQALDFASGAEFVALEPTLLEGGSGSDVFASQAADGRADFLLYNQALSVVSLVITQVQEAAGCPPQPTSTVTTRRAAPGELAGGPAVNPPAYLDVTPLGWWGGEGSPVAALVDGVVFESQGGRFVALRPGADGPPTTLGSIQLDGVAQGLAVADGVAWVTTGRDTLWAVNVRDSRRLEVLGRADGLVQASQVVVEGERVYVVSGGGVSILDGADPAHPTEVGWVPYQAGSGSLYVIAVQGTHVYAIDGGDAGVRVWDLADPAQPRQIGALLAGRTVVNVAVSEGRLYTVLGGVRPVLAIYDLATPEAPAALSELALQPAVKGQALAFSQDRVFVGDGAILVLSVRDPRAPTVVARLHHAAPVASMAVDGDTLLAVDRADGRHGDFGAARHLVDIGEPSAPRAVASWDPDGWLGDVGLNGTTAYVSSPDGLRALDVTDPAVPVSLGPPGGPPAFEWLGDLLVDGNHAYVTNDRRLTVLDLADPHAIREVGELRGQLADGRTLGEDLPIGDLHGGDGRLCTFLPEEGMLVVDVSDPTFPRPLGLFRVVGNGLMAQDGDRAAVVELADTGVFLTMVDVSDPCAPRALGQYGMRHADFDVALSGDTAYLWERSGGPEAVLLIVDVSDPNAPRLASTLHEPVVDMAFAGGLTWLVGHGMLTALDVTDPEQPRVVARQPVADRPRSLAVSGDIVYVTFGELGLQTFRMTPGRPHSSLYLPTATR